MSGKNTYTVLAFDPGGKSGWARFDVQHKAITGNTKILNAVVDWDYGILTGLENDQVSRAVRLAMKVRDEYLTLLHPQMDRFAIVSELFVPRKMSQQQQFYSPLRINAKLDYQLWLNGIELNLQQPSIAFGQVDSSAESDRDRRVSEKLNEWGYYVPQKDTRAAVMHAFAWLRRVAAKG